ncbi:YheC/YheD family protein [Paenibacillus cymbidii]|uniref:YheC/YheD family protein n=1 Tax=Paenibacillus cymbidii TaxID=1639034 RepID=UPI001436784A|nr:YheC/YheD family protein [Paenibacillus cymbidii]
MQLGVFHPHDPFAVMPEGRVQAIAEEAVRQHAQAVFFNESGIDLDKRTVSGRVFAGGGWETGVFPFPQAVMNVRPWGPRRRSDRELIFRKMVPFTAFLIDDKWAVTNMIASVPSLAPHVVPTALLRDADQIDDLFASHDKLILKPSQGSRGAGVQALVREGSRYGLQRGAEWVWLDRGQLAEFVRQLRRDYLIQPYIVCLTPEGEPYDFRILVQRDGTGNWGVSLMYPRIGGKDTVTSNVSVGGRTEPLGDFLQRLFPNDCAAFPQRLAELGLAIAVFLDSRYAHPLDELGIDLAIDAQRRIWFYEANTCPGTLFYEKERAVQTVAYAKYVAAQAMNAQASIGAAPGADATLGLLLGRSSSPGELEAYVDVARNYGVKLAYFYLDGVGFRSSSVTGFRHDGRQWQAATFAAPDIVYNMLDAAGAEADASHALYRPSSNLPLTSREPKGPIPAPLFFAIAARNPQLAGHLPHFLRPSDPQAAKRFVDRHEFVVMRSDAASQTGDMLLLKRLPTHYAVHEAARMHAFNEAEFLEFLALFDDANYILIEKMDSRTHDGHALHIHANLSRQPGGGWEVARIVPLLALASPDPTSALPFAADWDWLLDREYGEAAETIDAQIRALAGTSAKQLQAANRNRLHELVLDFAIDAERVPRLLGGEIDGPGDAVHPYDNARRVIPFALSLLQTRYEKASKS